MNQDEIREKLEKLREQYHKALDKAGGNHQDPKVQRLSEEVNKLVVQLMKKQR